MVNYNNVISVIRDNGGFKPNKDDSSFYRTYLLQDSKPIQVRLSNHGTHLWTWDKNGEYIPSYAINICVVFMSATEGYSKPNTAVEMVIKDEKGNVVGQKKDYEIIEYVYNCDNLSAGDCAIINKEITSIPTTGGFKDPFSDDAVKHCTVYRLRPNTNPELIKETKYYSNMNTNKIKLTESQLKEIISETVKKVLKEGSEDKFAPDIKRDIATLQSIYEKWQYATYKPDGIDKAIDTILDAKHTFEELLPNTPDYGPYDGEPYTFGY